MGRPITILAAVLLLAAVVLWLGTVANLATLTSSDQAGNALSQAYGAIMTLVLWLLLAILLWIAAGWGEMPGWAKGAAFFLLPLSCAASLASIELLKHSGAPRWPIVVPALSGLLLMAYAVWAYLPAVRGLVPANVMSPAIWGAVLVLGLAPWPFLLRAGREGAARRAESGERQRLAQEQQLEASRKDNLARFRRLTDDSPLGEWLEFTTGGNELREEALTRIRRLARRQQDAEAMIAAGHDLPMLELHHLDLQLTPALCGIAREFLQQDARAFRPGASDAAHYPPIAFRVERHVLAMQYLAGGGCDIRAALEEYMTTVRAYPESPEGTRFLARLASLIGDVERGPHSR